MCVCVFIIVYLWIYVPFEKSKLDTYFIIIYRLFMLYYIYKTEGKIFRGGTRVTYSRIGGPSLHYVLETKWQKNYICAYN